MRLCQRLCEHTTSCVRENTAGQMFVFAPDTSCLPRDERSKKFVPEEIKGAQRLPPHSHSAQAKRPKLIVEKEALAPRANWPLDVFVVGFGRRPASSVAASHISLPLTRTQCCFEIAYYIYAHLRAKSKWARSQGKCRSQASRGCTPAAYLIGRVRAV